MNETINDVLRKDYDSCVKDLKKSEKKREKLEKENQKLNNVLNELEKWLENKKNLVGGCGITIDYIYAYENVLDYLKELKESDK